MKGTKLPGTEIEVINEVERGRFKHVLFDFDGTVSLLREAGARVIDTAHRILTGITVTENDDADDE